MSKLGCWCSLSHQIFISGGRYGYTVYDTHSRVGCFHCKEVFTSVWCWAPTWVGVHTKCSPVFSMEVCWLFTIVQIKCLPFLFEMGHVVAGVDDGFEGK